MPEIYLKDELWTRLIWFHIEDFLPSLKKRFPDIKRIPEARQIWIEKPIYSLDFYSEKMADAIRKEGIRAVAISLKYREDSRQPELCFPYSG